MLGTKVADKVLFDSVISKKFKNLCLRNLNET